MWSSYDDIVIGGRTAFDANRAAPSEAILAEWTSSGLVLQSD